MLICASSGCMRLEQCEKGYNMGKSRTSKQNGLKSILNSQKNDVYKFKKNKSGKK